MQPQPKPLSRLANAFRPSVPASNNLTIALAQLNPTIGAIDTNLAKARAARSRAQEADLIVFPELFLCGYPPEDLALRASFLDRCQHAIEALALETKTGASVLIGVPWRDNGQIYNACALLTDGRIEALRYKHDLPNYGVFDEKRIFSPGPVPEPIAFKGVRLGVPICEDIWTAKACGSLAQAGAEILLSPNGSPFEQNKNNLRLKMAIARVTETGLPLAYLNQIGGQDELVFDGASFVLDAHRTIALRMPMFEEAIALTHWRRSLQGWSVEQTEAAHVDWPSHEEEIWQACILGLRDYVEKNNFPHVILGLSGGIDSAVVAAMAVDALGPKRVHCFILPYLYSSAQSLEDAETCAKLLGVVYDTIPIHQPVEGFFSALTPFFNDQQTGIWQENIQSRTRGTMLMAISNKTGALLLTTGNKSEMAVGYATIYGDMNGGFNPVKDIYKTSLYRLARWRNSQNLVIPDTIMTKPPSAELRPEQKDQDSLPAYEILDDILECLVEADMSIAAITARGHDEALIRHIENLLYRAEYKRRQSAPGTKITRRNLGRDRRYPITNSFRG